jgi:DNA-binding NarL/FixJ family response regulator
MIRIAVVEDDPVIRSGLQEYLQSRVELAFDGAYESAEGFLMRDEGGPDVLLLDIELPGISGLEAAFHVKEKNPDTNILIFTVYEDPERIFRALQCGVSGYLLKNTPLEKLVEAISEVASGGSPLSPLVARKVMNYFSSLPPLNQASNVVQLTPREREVAFHLVEGHTYKEVAGILFVSTDTIRQHIKNIYRKLHINSRIHLVREFNKPKGW